MSLSNLITRLVQKCKMKATQTQITSKLWTQKTISCFLPAKINNNQGGGCGFHDDCLFMCTRWCNFPLCLMWQSSNRLFAIICPRHDSCRCCYCLYKWWNINLRLICPGPRLDILNALLHLYAKTSTAPRENPMVEQLGAEDGSFRSCGSFCKLSSHNVKQACSANCRTHKEGHKLNLKSS